MRDTDMIKEDTPITLYVFAGALVGLFALYQVFEPQFKQIEVNKVQVDGNSEMIREMKHTHSKYNQHILNISNALSRIEGRLDTSTLQQSRR